MLPHLDIVKLILISAGASACLVFPVERIFRGLWIVDHPSHRRVHGESVARAGGVVILLALIISLQSLDMARIVSVPISSTHYRFVYLLSFIVLLGLIDDRFDLKWNIKLLFQILASLAIVANSSSFGILVPTPEDRLQLFLLYLVTVNAINLIDGLNGLCISICFLSLVALFFLSDVRWLDGPRLLIFIPILLGAILGIARFNFSSPRIFLGESGAMLLGFVLATFFTLAAQSRSLDSKDTCITFSLIFGLPLIELLSSCVRRFVFGLSVGKGILEAGFSIVVADAKHLHHRLLERTKSQKKALALLCLLHGVCLVPIFIFYL
jgi:UDP-GlcNAc:undecaprenyl-phosphate GlcNAc-1-phosphate transferase